MTLVDLDAQIADRTASAITEALDQLNNGWTDREVLVVATDAWDTIADLKDQAAAVQSLHLDALVPLLWDTACGQQSPMHHTLRCYLEAGHHPATDHLYTVKTHRRAA